MTKIKGTVALAIGLALAPSWQAQETWRQACVQQCYTRPTPGDPEMQRQEIRQPGKRSRTRHPIKKRHLLSARIQR